MDNQSIEERLRVMRLSKWSRYKRTTITLDGEVWKTIQSVKEIGESNNDTLRRIFGLNIMTPKDEANNDEITREE